MQHTDPKWQGTVAWDVLLLRLLKDENGPLFWKKCGASTVVPCMGSWSGHTSGSQSKAGAVEPCGFEKSNNKNHQAGTRKWLSTEKERYLYGFSWTGALPQGPKVQEVAGLDAATSVGLREGIYKGLTWFSQPPPEVTPKPPKSSEDQLPFKHPELRPGCGFPDLAGFGPEGCFHAQEQSGSTRKRRCRDLVSLYERRVWSADQDEWDASWTDQLLPRPFMVANRDCLGGVAALRGYSQSYCKPIDDLYRDSMYVGRITRRVDEHVFVTAQLRDRHLWQVSCAAPTVETSLAVVSRDLFGGRGSGIADRSYKEPRTR